MTNFQKQFHPQLLEKTFENLIEKNKSELGVSETIVRASDHLKKRWREVYNDLTGEEIDYLVNEAENTIVKKHGVKPNKNIDIVELKSHLENTLHKVAAETNKSNPMSGTPLAGYPIIQAVTESGKVFKEEFKKDKKQLRLTEEQIDEIVDEVVKRTLKKYISNI